MNLYSINSSEAWKKLIVGSYIPIGMGSFRYQMSIVPDPCKWSWVCGNLPPDLINIVTPAHSEQEWSLGFA